ncbi:MAG: oligopeptidase B, partial [Bacteroidales bacterium]|nr:oligopeptidase B [Bacteroidales bacterium]
MKKNLYVKTTLLLAVVLVVSSCSKSTIQPPDVKQIPKEITIHGKTRVDNYYWLNERENPEVIAYLEAENEYTKAILKPTEKLQEDLFTELKSRIKEDDESVPYKENGYFYYSRFETGKEYPIYCRKKDNLESPEEIMLNVNDMAVGHDYFQVSGLSVSPDNKLLAFGVDTVSRRNYTIYIKNLETGELLSDAISNTVGYAEWANDNKTFFYVKKDQITLRSFQIYRHELSNSTSDFLVYQEDDETFSAYVTKTKSNKYLLIGSSSTMADEYRFLDA